MEDCAGGRVDGVNNNKDTYKGVGDEADCVGGGGGVKVKAKFTD